MRILLITTSYNGLCQRAHIELEELGHDISLSLSKSEDEMRTAVSDFQPDLIICPFLKERVPEDIWKGHTCIIIHPGIKRDRGPSSLDWAIKENLKTNSFAEAELLTSNPADPMSNLVDRRNDGSSSMTNTIDSVPDIIACASSLLAK